MLDAATYTAWYHTLPPITGTDKYARWGATQGYKLCTARAVLPLQLPRYVYAHLQEHGPAVLIPNYTLYTAAGWQLQGCVLRSIAAKHFVQHSLSSIPHGAGMVQKPYSAPWVVVESALDADILRSVYPYTLATYGTTVARSTVYFLQHTAPYCILCMDNDAAGAAATRRLQRALSAQVLQLPYGARDIGELYDTELWAAAAQHLQLWLELHAHS